MASEEASSSSWLDTFITDLDTGGKYHKAWEAVEKVGSVVVDKKLDDYSGSDKGENLDNELNKTSSFNQQVQNFDYKKYLQNPILWAIGGVFMLIIFVVKGAK